MKNNDLISRAEAIAVVRSMTVFLGGEQIFHPEVKQSVLNALNDISDIDAEPVRHGQWIDDRTEMVCSECKAVYSDELVFMNKDFKFDDPPYCPNCGAKMDAEVKG